MDQDIDDSSAQDEDTRSLDVEMGELSINQTRSLENPTPTRAEEGRGGGGVSKNKIIFEPWARTLVMVPFTITITIVASFWAINGDGDFKLTSFPLHSFFFIVMLNFYVSVIGIIVGHRFPSVASGFYLVGFLCVLLSLTILFWSILPNVMNVVPWVFLVAVALLAISLVLYENCSH